MPSGPRRGAAYRGAAYREVSSRVLVFLTKIRRIGIVARLSASFVAVAILAIAANYLAGHSYTTQTTRIERSIVILPQPVVSVPAPVVVAAPGACALACAQAFRGRSGVLTGAAAFFWCRCCESRARPMLKRMQAFTLPVQSWHR